ncbi:MAG TPA: c-type cytochrome [Bacteroidia bacterium]|jgi:cytochrome c2|nr:c-type cytochrome [Bacteroidia bacterium]
MRLKTPQKSSVFFPVLFLFSRLLFAANTSEGGRLFKANCAVCHSIGSNKVIGPGLEGISERAPIPYQVWLNKWIKNNVALRESGDAYANQIFTDYKGYLMPVFEGSLTDQQIQDIIAFLTIPKPDTIARSENLLDGKDADKRENTTINYLVYFLLLGILLIITITLHNIRITLQAIANTKKGITGLPAGNSIQHKAIAWLRNNKLKLAVLFIFCLILLSGNAWSYMWNIHVTPGYHPSQPINFIHKVHAEDNQIPCLYCHSGAEKGKVAGIPTLNVCMNCHKGIQGSTSEYRKEIAKIYYAVGWDTIKGNYINAQHPIHWNRVHSLPDFAYFNHAQHVVVGKITCQKCHGNCSSFTTNHQAEQLTMGWCIDCHRKALVQMSDNGYYKKLHLAILKSFGSDTKVTEADMGGLECGKCHY